MNYLNGIHHITAIAGDPQVNVDFYTSVLGLRLVKKTVNFDDPYTYHLYYGDDTGTPGTILTFFPWGENVLKGRKGTGQITTISFSIASSSLNYWMERLTKCGISFTGPYKNFNDDAVLFEDPDGFEIELIAGNRDKRNFRQYGDIPAEHSIKGFYSVTISEEKLLPTENMLISLLGFKKQQETENRIRYSSGSDSPGNYVDILLLPESLPGRMGVGAVHHIAFRVSDKEVQQELRQYLLKNYINVTSVVDRNYFYSIYFKEPGNVLFEAATDPPGFLIDESPDELGTNLKLPSWYENRRKEIENSLTALTVSINK